VLNRANARLPVFESHGDYEAFLAVLDQAHQRVAMRMIGFCVMPNHWHLVLWPRGDDDLSEFMRWLTMTHTQRWHAFHGTAGSGHVYQGRFKSFPVQSRRPSAAERAMGVLEAGNPVLSVLRYVERNALRAGMVQRAEAWRWGSLFARGSDVSRLACLTPPPGGLPSDWVEHVNRAQTDKEIAAVRRCVQRSAPFGGKIWAKRAAKALGLEHTLRPRGRPRKRPKKGS